MPFVNRIARIGLALSLGVIWMGGWLILLAQSDAFMLRLLAIFMEGIASTVVWDGSLGLMQVLPPDHMRFQMLTTHNIVGPGLMPFASLVLSALADRTSLSLTVLLSGFAMTLLAVLMLARMSWRHWQIQPPRPQAENRLPEV